MVDGNNENKEAVAVGPESSECTTPSEAKHDSGECCGGGGHSHRVPSDNIVAAIHAGDLAANPPSAEAPVGPPTDAHVYEKLKSVIDPELFINIVDLGLIYNVDIKEVEGSQYNVAIDMTMTSPMCPAGPQLVANSKSAVRELPGIADVDVKVVMDPPWTPEKMTEEARDQLGIF